MLEVNNEIKNYSHVQEYQTALTEDYSPKSVKVTGLAPTLTDFAIPAITPAEPAEEITPEEIIVKVEPAPKPTVKTIKNYSTGDAYTHELTTKWYEATAEDLDAYLMTQNIPTFPERINGEKLLHWQELSGIDVRAIMSKSKWESSWGTRGVAATVEGCNMFGYGAYDSNPEACAEFSDEDAMIALGEKMKERPYWHSFKLMDDAALMYNHGEGPKPEGGVYYSSTVIHDDCGLTGQCRAQEMDNITKFVEARHK